MTDTTSEPHTTEADAVVDLARRADGLVVAAVIKTDDGRTFMAHRHDMTVDDITPENAAKVELPKFVGQNVIVQRTDSLVDYVNRFKNDDTMLFADIRSNRILAVIDYHGQPGAGDAQDKTLPSPRLLDHTASLNLPFSEEWNIWTGQNNKLLSHRAFATFLEENVQDISEPAGASVLEICRDLQVINNVAFKSTIRMGDTTKVEFAAEKDATSKGDVALPNSFVLSIPVYFGENPVKVLCFMRRSIDEGTLRLGYAMMRLESIRQDEFNRIVGEVAAGVKQLTTVYGTPA